MAIAGQNFSSALKEEDEIKFQCDTLKHEYLNNNHIMKYVIKTSTPIM